MADRLIKTPTSDMTWFVQCAYCKITNMGHETELLAKAKRLCKNHQTNHFLDYVTAELDTLDHSILNPNSEVEILTQIHTQTGCDCLNPLSADIAELTRNTHNVTIPAAYAVTSEPKPTTRTPSKKPARTLMERLKNGTNGQTTH